MRWINLRASVPGRVGVPTLIHSILQYCSADMKEFPPSSRWPYTWTQQDPRGCKCTTLYKFAVGLFQITQSGGEIQSWFIFLCYNQVTAVAKRHRHDTSHLVSSRPHRFSHAMLTFYYCNKREQKIEPGTALQALAAGANGATWRVFGKTTENTRQMKPNGCWHHLVLLKVTQ